MTDYRTESDSFGKLKVPSDKYYGAQTARSLINFPIGEETMPAPLVRALGIVKRSAALANMELDNIDKRRGKAIVRAATEVAKGKFDDNFPLSVWQTGSGTQSNMNTNEVISNRAIEILGGEIGSKDPVHPNDHVNRSQSSNDTFPTAMHISTVEQIQHELLPALTHLHAALEEKQREFAKIIKIGRTHTQDATPVTLGQEFGGYARQVRLGVERIENALQTSILELALGGTAVGTGLNTPDGFPARVIELVAERTGIAFREAEDHFEAQGARDGLVDLSGALKTVAVSLIKIANDVRWLSSGPRTGIGELQLPAIQPGSSIMPGKVNPVIPESVRQVGAQVIGNDAAVAVGGLSGELELNVMIPMMATNVIESLELLANVSRIFVDKCLADAEATDEGPRMVERSLMSVTALVPEIGYERSAGLAKQAHAEGKTLREVAIEDGVDEELLDRVLDHRRMAEGGIL